MGALSEDDEFIRFAAQEVAGIAEALDRSVRQLALAPMDRDPLKSVLRRQRTLLGAARLDEIPVVAEILRAVEDLTRVIARLDVGVKQDWLDVYRVARDGLRQALEPLQRGEPPPHTNSVSRLRHMRYELVERFGSGEDVSAAHDSRLVQAQAVEEPFQRVALPAAPDADAVLELDTAQIVNGAADAEDEGADEEHAPDVMAAAAGALQLPGGVVPVESLCYAPEDALRQALTLQDAIMRATPHDPEARAAAEELFDLIRYALG
jgi:chemotaxis protein histidine kinase CheA